MKSVKKAGLFAASAAVLLVLVPSLRELFKFLPVPVAVAAMVMISAASAWIFLKRDFPVDPGTGWILLLAIFFAMAMLNGLLISYGVLPETGSTGDEAMMEPVHSIMEKGSLWAIYDVQLEAGAPVSPGPGWILLNSPFTILGIYPLMVPFWFLVLTLVLRRSRFGDGIVMRLMLLLALSPFFWQQLITGHDLPAIGAAFLAITAAAHNGGRVMSRRRTLILALVAGIVSTSRVIYLLYPLIPGILIRRRDRTNGYIFISVALTGAFLINMIFSARCSSFQPIHILSRVFSYVPPWALVAGAFIAALTVIVFAWKSDEKLKNWILWLSLLIGIPHLLISLAWLAAFSMDPAAWEGANYFSIFLPAALTWLLMVEHDIEPWAEREE